MVFALAFWSLICTISNQACEGGGGPLSTQSDNSAYLWLFCIRRDDGGAWEGQGYGKPKGSKIAWESATLNAGFKSGP